MGWDSAKRYKPRPIGETGAYVPPAPAAPYIPEPEPVVVSAEDRATIARYKTALRELGSESAHFAKNRNIFEKWDDVTRLWWISKIEKQAADGKDTIGAHVVTRVVMNRIGD